VRVSVAHESGLAIFDRRCALVWDNVPGCGQHCLLIRAPAVVKPLLRLADTTWESALDLEVFDAFRDPGVDAVAMKVIGLLSSGHKDDVAARQLGVSVRTFRRHVADIMDRLGAKSRFEAGVRAATLGLVDPAAARTRGRTVPGSLSLTAAAARPSSRRKIIAIVHSGHQI
jgi:DNA-binding CsgD family transcriptional regulator